LPTEAVALFVAAAVKRLLGRKADCRGSKVKLVIAIIQPPKLDAVREALAKVEVHRLTICDAQGFGRQRGQKELFRGNEYRTILLRKVVLEIVVNDDFLDRTIQAIVAAARSGAEGNIGDGKIFVVPMDEAFSVASGQSGPGAVN